MHTLGERYRLESSRNDLGEPEHPSPRPRTFLGKRRLEVLKERAWGDPYRRKWFFCHRLFLGLTAYPFDGCSAKLSATFAQCRLRCRIS
jgi:hypothetical protein